MDQSTEIEFNVDEQYENEKGVFKVVSIQKDQMVIRWEDGEETRTDIALQRRIAERRKWEERQRLAEIKTAEEARRKSAAKTKPTVFAGLAATDFKTNANRTTWRSRSQLGGAVTKKLSDEPFKFDSWAVGRQPEMHVQAIGHHDATQPANQCKFFVRIDPQAIYYGLRATRPDNAVDAPNGWPALRDWLSREENEKAFYALAMDYHLSACNRARPSTCIRAVPDAGGWLSEKGEKSLAESSLTDHFEATPPDEPLDFELFATLSKDDAVACGRDIASLIARLFNELLPFYLAAANR